MKKSIKLFGIFFLLAFGQMVKAKCDGRFIYIISNSTYNFQPFPGSTSTSEKYFWDFGDGTTSKARQNFHNYAKYGTYTVKFVLRDTIAKCIDSSTTVIKFYGSPCDATYNAAKDSKNYLKYNFVPVNTVTKDYHWYVNGNDNGWSKFDTAFTFKSNGLNTVCMASSLYISPNGYCNDTFCRKIKVKPCLTNFQYQVHDTTNEYLFQVYRPDWAKSKFLWDMGDGNTSTISFFNHTYKTKGTYKVCVYSDSAGCKDTLCQTIVANKTNPCNAEFTAIQDKSNPLKWVFTAMDTTEDFYYWKPYPGNIDIKKFTYTFSSKGSYNAELTVFNINNHCVDTVIKSINTVRCPITLSYLIHDTINNYYFYALRNNWHLYSYKWDLGDGNTSTRQGDLHYTYKSNGTYKACVYTDSAGCKDTACVNIVANKKNPCNANFKAVQDKSNPLIWHFEAIDTMEDYYSWGWVSGPKKYTHTFSAKGTYSMSLWVDNYKDHCRDTVTKSINVQQCSASFTVSINNATNTATFTNTSSSDMTYFKWHFGDGKTSTAKNPSHTYTAAGNYTVVLIANDSVPKCLDTAYMSISINGCDAYFTYSINDTVLRYYHNNPSRNKIKWDFGNGKTSTKDSGYYNYSKSGTYQLCLTVYCSSTDSGVTCKSITINPRCKALFKVALDTTQKFKLYLINKSSNTSSTQYTWDFGDGNYSGNRNPTHKYSKFGKYNVCLLVIDTAINCSSKYCDTLGLDSSGKLLKAGAFELVVIDESVFGVKKIVKSDFKIYPNPANTKVTIDLSNAANKYQKMEIINSNGQVCIVQNIETGSETMEVDLEQITRGLYLIKLSNDQGYSYIKMMKN